MFRLRVVDTPGTIIQRHVIIFTPPLRLGDKHLPLQTDTDVLYCPYGTCSGSGSAHGANTQGPLQYRESRGLPGPGGSSPASRGRASGSRSCAAERSRQRHRATGTQAHDVESSDQQPLTHTGLTPPLALPLPCLGWSAPVPPCMPWQGQTLRSEYLAEQWAANGCLREAGTRSPGRPGSGSGSPAR